MRSRVLVTAVSLVTLAACEAEVTKPSLPTPPAPSQQTWLCGREYVNHAWGYQRYGVVFDTAGNIWRYKVDRAPVGQRTPWDPQDMTRLTEADLKMRYESATVVPGKKVPLPEIEKVSPLIGDAAQAKPTEPQPHGADMGQTLLYCYTHDARSGTYSQVMLDNNGDYDSTNPSKAAQTLRSWVKSWIGDIN